MGVILTRPMILCEPKTSKSGYNLSVMSCLQNQVLQGCYEYVMVYACYHNFPSEEQPCIIHLNV